jgi:hypothetical protein
MAPTRSPAWSTSSPRRAFQASAQIGGYKSDRFTVDYNPLAFAVGGAHLAPGSAVPQSPVARTLIV